MPPIAVDSSDAWEISPIAHAGSLALFTIVVVFGGKVVHRSYTADTIR